MAPEYAQVDELTRAISLEIMDAAGLARTSPLQAIFRPFLWPLAHRFATQASEFDRRVATSGLMDAIRWALSLFVDGTQAHGVEHIPSSGPLIIATNHPGSYDGMVIAKHLGREDLKVIASDVPFLRFMRASARHLIYTTLETSSRMAAARAALRHLQHGGALLLYPSAQVDPDPAVLPGAMEELNRWSGSLPLFIRKVPETQVLVSIVSGVLAPSCYRNPLTLLQREEKFKRKLAEFLQVGQQIMFGRQFGLKPEVRFGTVLRAAELGDGRDQEAAMAVILAQAGQLLSEVKRTNLEATALSASQAFG
jgi:hypothetical protein